MLTHKQLSRLPADTIVCSMESGVGDGQDNTMIEDIETGNDTSNFTVIDHYEDTNSTDTSFKEDILDMFANIHRISPFVLAVVGGGIMLSVLICTVLAVVIRINTRRRVEKEKKVMKNGRSSVRSGCGGFEQPPYLGMRDTVRVNSSRFTHRYADCLDNH